MKLYGENALVSPYEFPTAILQNQLQEDNPLQIGRGNAKYILALQFRGDFQESSYGRI